MKNISVIIFGLLFAFCDSLSAQNAHFSTDGIIEFDKTVNMYALIGKSINKDNESYMTPVLENYKKTKPQFKILKSTLTFLKDKALFSPVENEEDNDNGFGGGNVLAEQNNIIFTDLLGGKSISQKKVYEETFLVKDSTRRINWKITTETRDIAGFKCRRANALILDSIYVVAFYTDEIPVSAGPESFSGLPGMILGVALPHENITWFATKVTETLNATQKAVTPPTKGKPINNKELAKTLKAALKDWGDYAQLALKAFSL